MLGLAFFTPTIVKGYGYGAIQTQLHSVPPTAVAWLMSVILAYVSDRFRLRSPFVAFSLAVAITGSGILLSVHDNVHLEYGAIFLLAMGTYSCMPIVICWYTMNLRGGWERGVGTGWMIGFGNIGAIVATFSFTIADAPLYHKGYSIIMGGLCIVIVSATIYFLLLLKEKRKIGSEQRSAGNKGNLRKSSVSRYYL